MFIALGLIFTGVLFLLRNAGVLVDPVWGIVWPLTLIVIGAAVLLEKGMHRSYGMCWPGCPCMYEGSGKGTSGTAKKRSAS